MASSRHTLLLTGPPGVGKTTVVRRVVERLRATVSPAGFYTEEIRVGGVRRGFRAVSFAGTERILAHVDIRSSHTVGKYGVDVAAVDELAATTLAPDDRHAVYVVDEIGRMECLSSRFIEAMRLLLSSDRLIVATIGLRGEGFISEAKTRTDAELWHVSRANRDLLVERAVAWLDTRLASFDS